MVFSYPLQDGVRLGPCVDVSVFTMRVLASCDFSDSAALSALTAARDAARRLAVASRPSLPPMLVLVLLGAGLGAGPCIVVFIRESGADRCQRVSQQSSNVQPRPLLY